MSESLTFFGLFLAGLGLNLTPCVYPMMAVTVSLFVDGEKRRLGAAFLRSSAYVAGIVAMFTALGAAAGTGGGLFGAALQNRAVLVGLALFIGILAASMFGLFEIRVPAPILSRLSGKRRPAGLIGLFFAGVVVGIFAAPCIGPPIVALLAEIGRRGDPSFGLRAFVVLGLGLGAPYLLLGALGHRAARLPRSGEWMISVKRIFGIALVGLAVFYLALALAPQVIGFIAPATLIACGLYLGLIEGRRKRRWGLWLRWTAGAAAIAFGIFLAVGGPRTQLVWESYTPEHLLDAKARGAPVIIDYFADWCIPCHKLHRITFADPRVAERLAGFVRLKVDLTNPETPGADEAVERFDVQGVPTLILVNGLGQEVVESRVTGYVPPEEFLEMLAPVAARPAEAAERKDRGASREKD